VLKQVPQWRSINWHHSIEFSHSGNLAPGICAPLPSHTRFFFSPPPKSYFHLHLAMMTVKLLKNTDLSGWRYKLKCQLGKAFVCSSLAWTKALSLPGDAEENSVKIYNALTKSRSKYISDTRLQWCHNTSLYYKNTNSTFASVLHVTNTLKF